MFPNTCPTHCYTCVCVDTRIFITAYFSVCYVDLLGQRGEHIIVLSDKADESLDKVKVKVGGLEKIKWK